MITLTSRERRNALPGASAINNRGRVMDKNIMKELDNLFRWASTLELDEVIQYIKDEKSLREAHELQAELEMQEYIELHDGSEEDPT